MMNSRRNLIKIIASAPLLGVCLSHAWNTGESTNQSQDLITRLIPSTGEIIPTIGMGSYQTFNIEKDPIKKAQLQAVLMAFFNAGGQLIDSSPMYGKSESVLGELITSIQQKPDFFAASKVWTYGKEAGLEAIAETQRRMSVDKMDLMQVHNLRDWPIQLATLNELKFQNKLRYTGITTSFLGQYDEFERVMEKETLDFVQLNYNIKVREAEKRLIPLAQEKGIAVIVNMPFEKGRLFKFVKGKALPEWAKEIDCVSWGQFFLKYIISHPGVTCAIPATSKVHHMQDNMLAMQGRLPDQKMRLKMLRYFEAM